MAYKAIIEDDPRGELLHYGVLGMKWGVHRATAKLKTNSRLERKALNYDKKSAKLNRKAEKYHSEYDLGQANKKAKKAAKLETKAAKVSKKALKSTNELEKTYLNRKSENLKYKASVKRLGGNRVARTTGYGAKASRYSIKSDMAAMKAAKARKKIANNKYYIERMNMKISQISPEDLKGAYSFVNELMGA